MPTLLLFAYYYPPQNTSGAARPARFARYLPEYGIQPLPITSRAANGGSRESTKFLSSACLAFQRLFLPFNENLPWLPHGIAAGAAACAKPGGVYLFSTSPPIVTHLSAWFLKRRYRLRWVADLRDPISDNPFRRSWRASIYLKWVERLVMQNADVVIANTDGLRRMLVERYPAFREKLVTVWNGYDPEQRISALPLPKRPYRVISHVGTLYGARHPGMLFQSLDRLFTSGQLNPDGLRIRLIGLVEEMQISLDDPPFRSLLASGCVEANRAAVPAPEAQRIMAESDYLLLLDLNESNIAVQVPAKLFEYIQIGRPILCFTTHNSPTEHILARSGIPHRCIYPGDGPETVDRAVKEFLALPADPQSPSSWFLDTFDARRQTELVARLCRGVPAAQAAEASE